MVASVKIVYNTARGGTSGSIHFLEGGWAGGIQGRVINFLPAQKGRGGITLTQQRVGPLIINFFLILYKFRQTDL